jgi:hypothetical protein
MMASHLVFLVEEPSMEAFISSLLPRLLPPDRTFVVHSFQGKTDLLGKLEARLRGYASWLPNDWRIVVVVDRDDDDCQELKRHLEKIAEKAKLRTRSTTNTDRWQLVNRIAIEELEAWYFGDWEAVRTAFPRVSPTVPKRSRYRVPDAIIGGTWEAFERIMQEHGYFQGGLSKIEAVRRIGACMDACRCQSKSFQVFRDALIQAVV